MGIMEALLSFIRRQIGLRTDAADTSGSLHAKMADLRNAIINTILPRTDAFSTKSSQIVRYRYTLEGGETAPSVTIAAVTGSGYLTGLTAITTGSSVGVIYFRITIDGSIVLDDIADNVRFVDAATGCRTNNLSAFLRFKSGLKIEAFISNKATIWATYILD